MAQTCYDQYDHPLLWCETKRRAEEKRVAEESWTIAQQRKEQIETQRQRDYNEVSKRMCVRKSLLHASHFSNNSANWRNF